MKIVLLIPGFAFIILSAILYNSGASVPAISANKSLLWIPIPIGVILFTMFFLSKENDHKHG
jgi:hypothetical protein